MYKLKLLFVVCISYKYVKIHTQERCVCKTCIISNSKTYVYVNSIY